jgi:pyruvate formate lyase activating enzyme
VFLIKGFDEMSLVDWDGCVAATVYVGRCNFRCPRCMNLGLIRTPDEYRTIPEEEILESVRAKTDFLDGVVITGGEPFVQRDLREFLVRLRETGLDIKIDTNGSLPLGLRYVLEQGLVDSVMIKLMGPLDARCYARCARLGEDAGRMVGNVRESVELLRVSGVNHAFRLRVVRGLHTDSDVEKLSEQLGGSGRLIIEHGDRQC